MTDAPQTFSGPFEVSECGNAVVLTRARGELRLICNGPGRHDLPARLDQVTVQRAGTQGAVRVTAGPAGNALVARSVQVHERAGLYGSCIALPRFAPGDRVKWLLLLWAARFAWGQALIGSLTRRRKSL